MMWLLSDTLACVLEFPDDWDDDGSPNAADCDDEDLDVHPDAEEIWYDAVDQDCDGNLDDAETACSMPSNHVANDDDCDDSDEDVWPGAPESCDGVDEDCDGDVDEDPSDGDTWWIDLDSDGYGNPILTSMACDQPSGYVDNSDDCNDLQPDAWPGNTEVCDGLDNDCDGDADEDDADDATAWYADSDGDGFGDADTSATQCEAPSDYVSGSTDCDDSDATINPSALEQCDGADNDCDGDTDEDEAIDVVAWYLELTFMNLCGAFMHLYLGGRSLQLDTQIRGVLTLPGDRVRTRTTETIRIWRQPRDRQLMPLVGRACELLTERKLVRDKRRLRFELVDRPGP